jgi:hypothetical protein
VPTFILEHSKIKILGFECQTIGTNAKNAEQAAKKRQRRGLLVFSPILHSAGSRPGCFHTSLGCKPRSQIRVSLGWFDDSKNVRKGNPTPAYSPVSDRRRLTALVEVHWARRVQAPMPQISGPNSQKNHIIETFKEDWNTPTPIRSDRKTRPNGQKGFTEVNIQSSLGFLNMSKEKT